jgi:hypothetical protein
MIEYYPNINSFCKIKENCIFCNLPLQPILRNYTNGPENKIPTLFSKLKDNFFNFKINYCSHSILIKSDGNINSLTNIINFYNTKFDTDYGYSEEEALGFAFYSLNPHIELSCQNSQCKYNYYLSSTTFGVARDIDKLKVPSISLAQEAFTLDNYFISNALYGKTNIYSVKDFNKSPIEINRIAFDSLGKERLLNRIRTAISFS